ncbi:N-acetylmuramoyl-L-alanine amidase [Streptomyces phyllanthi]|uniref:Tat pathway signal protein n=1 Tax=Streptomyces phyllanthi TaxID=1803180 RepID=A0A5N8W7Y9_9ACTN|nr:N-acetylmuramoyl-L-alanine amidase [Streptomyces phyllanthi]MPY43603.1 Tat pathway signal protein [Streptomyces phyllanthi]
MKRRSLLRAAGLAAGAAAVPALGAAAPAAAAQGVRSVRTPRTRAKSVTGAAARAVRADFPVEYVGVSWNGPRRGAGIRLIRQDGSRGEWTALRPVCGAGADGDGTHPAQSVSVLVPAGGAAGYELRLPDGATGVRSTAIDTVNGPSTEVAVAAKARRLGDVEYITRAGWGADESLRFKADGTENTPQTYYPAQTMTVHHTAGANGDLDPAATIRAYYHLHAVANDWGDIGYHFLIDEAGRIYEGRYSGTDGIPAHDTTGKMVTAFHAAGFNSGNLGVALLGTFTDQSPTAAARDSLTLLLAALSAEHGFDPQAAVTFVNPVNGVTRNVQMISGHRDWLTTECPGTTLYGDLPALRADVAAALSGS